MKIIADSGATKCTWLLTDTAGTIVRRTRGINAMQHPEAHIREALAELPPCGAVEHVWFYGAGCGAQFPEATARLTDRLAERFPGAQIEAYSDLCAAARALWGEGEGIACILGTGSNSCCCRGGEITDNIPPLGYILGDEGSGSALGKALLNSVFKRHIPLHRELLAFCGMPYEQVIHRIYGEPAASRFLASFAPFVAQHIGREDVRSLVADCFRAFVLKNLSRYPTGLPVAFVGGVAAHFEGLLREVTTQAGYSVAQIVESPAEGLLRYHYGT